MSEGDGGEEGGDAGGCCGGARFSRGGDDGMPECRPANSTRRACVGATCWSSEFALSANAPSRAAATSNSHDVSSRPEPTKGSDDAAHVSRPKGDSTERV